MSAAKLRSLMEKQGVEPEVVRLINAMVKNIGFTETLFVSVAGDNSDGSSWNRAYTNLKTALDWIEDNQETGEVHVVILGDGSWDMNLTGVPTYTKNIAIYGIDSRNQAVISNGHATATGVLKFTGWCSINNVSIDCGTGETGINLNGSGALGSRLRKLHFDCEALTAGNDAILLNGGISEVRINDIHVEGEVTNTTVIHFDDAFDCTIENIDIHTALIGIHLDHADDDDNHFQHCHVNNCATGIQIDNAGSTDNHFSHIHFHNCTARISDVGTTTQFSDVYLDLPLATIFPADLTGVVVAAGVGANTWTVAAVEIRSAAAATKPLYITGIKLEPATAEKWGIRLYDDGGTTPFWEGLIDAWGGGANVLQPEDLPEPHFVGQGKQISARVKSETGGNDMDIWLALEII